MFLRGVVSDCTADVLWGAASRIDSKQHEVYLCYFYRAFSPGVSLKSVVVQPCSSTDTATARDNSCLILSEISDFHLVVSMYMLASLEIHDDIIFSR